MLFKPFICLVLWASIQAMEDTFEWNNREVEDTLEIMAKEASSSTEKRQELLDTYSGTAAEGCKKALPQESYNYSDISVFLSYVYEKAKEIDMTWYNTTQACEGDQTCMEAAAMQGRMNLNIMKIQNLVDINTINAQDLQAVRNSMNRCLGLKGPGTS